MEIGQAREWLENRGTPSRGLEAADAFVRAGDCSAAAEALNRLSGFLTTPEQQRERERLRGDIAFAQKDYETVVKSFLRCLDDKETARKLCVAILATPVNSLSMEAAGRIRNLPFDFQIDERIREILRNLSDGCTEYLQLRNGDELAETLGIPKKLLERTVIEMNVMAAAKFCTSLSFRSLATVTDVNVEGILDYLLDAAQRLPDGCQIDEIRNMLTFPRCSGVRRSPGLLAAI